MGLFRHLLLASFCYTIICSIFTAESAELLGSYCDPFKNPDNNPTPATVRKLLANLLPAASPAGFATASYGGPGNKAYGLAQCRGDISTKDCSSCLRDAPKDIRIRCTADVMRDARVWYDFCFVRYSSDDFFGIPETDYSVLRVNFGNVSDPHSFTPKLRNLMGEISKQAFLPANKGLGKGKKKISDFVTLYGLVQCTRDLAPVDCAQCIAIAVGEYFSGFCKDSKGCLVIYSSCYVRYELYPFYFPIDSPVNYSTVAAAASDVRNYRSTVVIKP